MNKARNMIRKVLDGSERPAVLTSFGKDSMLLLSLIREVSPRVPCIWFHSGMNREQEKFAKRIIMEWDLEVWSWNPSDVYVVPNNKGLTLVKEQSFGDHTLPVLMDIDDGERCIADFPQERTLKLFPDFTDLFIGYKDTDYHWSLGGTDFCAEDSQLGRARVHAPLRHLTDSDVWQAIKELSVPYDKDRYEGNAPDPDTLQACTRCLQANTEKVFCPKEQKEIEPIAWDRAASLSAFRQRFGFKEAA